MNSSNPTPLQAPAGIVPSRIEKHSDSEMYLEFNSGERFAVPFAELRFACPCASCVDEHTGKRIIRREDVPAGIRPTGVSLVGRYAVQISWSDLHTTGMYSFDHLWKIAKYTGTPLHR